MKKTNLITCFVAFILAVIFIEAPGCGNRITVHKSIVYNEYSDSTIEYTVYIDSSDGSSMTYMNLTKKQADSIVQHK